MSSIVHMASHIGPAEALDLKAQLDELNQLTRPSIRVDLTQVESIHLGAVNALVWAAGTNARGGGQLTIVAPERPDVRAALSTAGLSPWMI